MAPPPNLPALLTADALPGIDAAEWPVIRDWLRETGELYDRLEFNVRLGDGRPSTGDDSLSTRRMWKAVTQVRADLIAWRGQDVDVVEAKVNARIEATSQVRRYAALFRAERRDVGRVTPVLICRTCQLSVEVSMHLCGGRAERVAPSA